MPAVLNCRKVGIPEGAIYVGRGSPWGNPFIIGVDGNRDTVIARFRDEILPTLDTSMLRGKNLVCWCAPKRCHADYLLEKANAREEQNAGLARR